MQKSGRLMVGGVSALALLLLAGCGSQGTTATTSSTGTTDTTTTSSLSWTQVDMQACADSVQKHLDTAMAANKNIPANAQVVASGQKISVDYVGRLADGSVFDTSVIDIAKACGKYQAGRDYTNGLGFTVGAGQMIVGFDKGVVGMKVGETRTLTIPAAEGYGEWSKEGLQTVPLNQLPAKPDGSNYKKGDKLYTTMGQTVTVYDVTGTGIVIDTNPELAGKELIFDVTIKAVQ